MNKKEILVPFIVIGLSALFAGICIGVFLTKGKSKKWIARKMKIGGLLLTLTAASCNGGGGGVETCYTEPEPNYFRMRVDSNNTIEINPDTSNVLSGQISQIEGTEFSFALLNEEQKRVQTGMILPKDGKFDAGEEDFKLELDAALTPGKYFLDLYDDALEVQGDRNPKRRVNITIKEE
jgi:hypothetical protein